MSSHDINFSKRNLIFFWNGVYMQISFLTLLDSQMIQDPIFSSCERIPISFIPLSPRGWPSCVSTKCRDIYRYLLLVKCWCLMFTYIIIFNLPKSLLSLFVIQEMLYARNFSPFTPCIWDLGMSKSFIGNCTDLILYSFLFLQ